MTFTTQDKLKAARREIAMRKNVYRKKVHDGRMKQEDADREIAVMQAIADDYAALETVAAPGASHLCKLISSLLDFEASVYPDATWSITEAPVNALHSIITIKASWELLSGPREIIAAILRDNVPSGYRVELQIEQTEGTT
jgi:hypothetical protein